MSKEAKAHELVAQAGKLFVDDLNLKQARGNKLKPTVGTRLGRSGQGSKRARSDWWTSSARSIELCR